MSSVNTAHLTHIRRQSHYGIILRHACKIVTFIIYLIAHGSEHITDRIHHRIQSASCENKISTRAAPVRKTFILSTRLSIMR